MKQIEKISNDILIEVKPIKLRQKITKDVFELLEQARKETAREILQKTKTILKANNVVFSEFIFDILALEFGISDEV